ncbi:MAG TPA: hypothetical protein DCY13_17935 [Verrucomicrobiales bacterium]|nr:hypothetical protein [Verrucomicrobiales bacterium]
MIATLLFVLLFLLCWPLALLALLAVPVIWLICLPFRICYWIIEGALSLIRALLLLPGRLLGGRSA